VRDLLVQQVARYARNHECPKGFNNIPCVVRSCNKLHATHEIMNARKGSITFRAWFGRATSCTLRTKSWMPERVK